MSIFDDPNFLTDIEAMGKSPWLVQSAQNSQPIATVPQNIQLPEIGVAGITNTGSAGGGGFLSGFGMDEAKLAMGGLQTIGQLWGAIQSAKLAKKSFNFQKEMSEANFANQMRAYNDALDGKRRTREIVEGQSAAQGQEYYDRFKARRTGG